MSRHQMKAHPYIESMVNGAMITQMVHPGQNAGRPLFVPGALPTIPDRRAATYGFEPIDWEEPFQEGAYWSRDEEIDDLAP